MPTYHVAKTGNDSTGNGSSGSPWLTVKKGITSLTPGDTLNIHAGTYVETLYSYNMTYPAGATSYAQAITIQAYPGDSVTLQGAITIRGLDFASFAALPCYYIWQNFKLQWSGAEQNGIDVRAQGSNQNAHHMKFINLELVGGANSNSGFHCGEQNPPQTINLANVMNTYMELINCNVHGWGTSGSNQFHGVYIGTSYNTIDGGQYWNNQGYGVQFNNSGTGVTSTGNILRNAKIYSNGVSAGGGVAITNSNTYNTNIQVYNNVIYNNGIVASVRNGIQIYTHNGAKIYNNTIYGNTQSGIGVGESGNVINSFIENNICKNNSQYGIDISSGSSS